MSISPLTYPILKVNFLGIFFFLIFIKTVWICVFSMSIKRFAFGDSLHCLNVSVLDRAEYSLHRMLLKWDSNPAQIFLDQEQHSPIQII